MTDREVIEAIFAHYGGVVPTAEALSELTGIHHSWQVAANWKARERIAAPKRGIIRQIFNGLPAAERGGFVLDHEWLVAPPNHTNGSNGHGRASKGSKKARRSQRQKQSQRRRRARTRA